MERHGIWPAGYPVGYSLRPSATGRRLVGGRFRRRLRRNHRRDEIGSAENVARAHAIWRAVIRLTTSGAYRHRYQATRAEAGAMTSAVLRSMPRRMSWASRSGA